MTSPMPVYIVSGARTAMGAFQGALSPMSAPQLGAIAIQGAMSRSTLDPTAVTDVFLGCVLTAGLKQGPARQAALSAQLGTHTGCTTVNKLCGSGMQATMLAHHALLAGSAELAIAGGMESMSNAPYLALGARRGLRIGHHALSDHLFLDGLEDAASGKLMGAFAQHMADKKGLTREAMDEFASTSLQRAQRAITNGDFVAEITPVTVTHRKSSETIATDEQPSKANLAKIPSLKPAFSATGTITAATSSSISDGASALLLATEQAVQQHQLEPVARIIGQASQSQAPEEFTIAPIGAIDRLLSRIGWRTQEVDLWEINEAFAMVAMAAMQAHDLAHDIVNVNGGACALGHPIGSTGSRIILTLIHALKQRQLKRGVATLCIGGGEATAMAIELC